ncbi:MAG: DNA repair protein RadC [Schleiferiaceae bacterium]|jgi:DNA repair protein RadC|nr:DNA repair protein RadC [Schleiferiaceae bacterium]
MSEPNNHNSIKTWAEDDRPREKLILKGKNALSDSELIAILIGSGSRELSAVDLAKKILNHVDNDLNSLGRLNVKELCKFKGIGEAKAISIITALELGKRRKDSEAIQLKKITSSTDAFQLLQPLIGDLGHEEFWVLYLSNANKVIRKEQLSIGGITGTVADVRKIFKTALEQSATAMIIAHNHPSGTLTPSLADKKLTQKVKDGGTLLDIKLLDHIIVTEKNYFSFADEGLL